MSEEEQEHLKSLLPLERDKKNDALPQTNPFSFSMNRRW